MLFFCKMLLADLLPNNPQNTNGEEGPALSKNGRAGNPRGSSAASTCHAPRSHNVLGSYHRLVCSSASGRRSRKPRCRLHPRFDHLPVCKNHEGNSRETAKTRKATEDSAQAVLESVQLAKRQIEEQTDIGETILDTTLWKIILAAETILAPDPFVNSRARDALARLKSALEDTGPAIRHVARTDPETAKMLTTCFENLRSGANAAQNIQNMPNPNPSNSGFQLTSTQTAHTLQNAVNLLKEIKSARAAERSP